jgi:cell cycle checkpoint protein
LTENDVITDVGLRTIAAEELLNFNFRSSPVLNKVIVQPASCLKEAFNELDWSSQNVTVLLSPDPPYFRLSTQGTAGSCQVDYPKDSEAFEAFECQELQMFTYKLKSLQPSVKALNQAVKTQMRLNARGLLSLQHMIKSDNHTSFVDFFIVPNEPGADDAD